MAAARDEVEEEHQQALGRAKQRRAGAHAEKRAWRERCAERGVCGVWVCSPPPTTTTTRHPPLHHCPRSPLSFSKRIHLDTLDSPYLSAVFTPLLSKVSSLLL